MKIHPTAIIEKGAQLGRDVEVGPYSVIGPHVVLGDRCLLHNHVTIAGHTTLGESCEIFPQAILGTPPQDVKFRGERTTLEIGCHNIFREMVTVHPGTGNGGGITRIGDRNLFLIGVHIAHDCLVGSRCIFANYVQLAGHIHVEDCVNMGGHSAVHHFVTIGRHAFIGGMTRVAADVPPYVIVVAARGTRSEPRMINGVGLQRSGFSQDDIAALKDAFMKIFSRRARLSGITMRDRVQAVIDAGFVGPHVEYLCDSLMRSFAHGRNGRYLESLRADPVHRNSWKLENRFTLSVNVVGRGIVRRAAGRAESNAPDTLELTALADPGWSFNGWNGHQSGESNPVRVVLDADKTIDATFVKQA